MKTVTLNIPRLGGDETFNILEVEERGHKYRYVCSTWVDDGLENDANYDILEDLSTGEYFAQPA